MKERLSLLSILALVFFLAVAPPLLTGCGGSSGDGESESDGDDDGGSSGGGTTTSRSCETEGNHSRYYGQDCSRSGCHATSKTMSYAGSAPNGGTVVILENGGATYNLKVNGDGNFCMRSKYGGNPGGGYTAMYGATMIVKPTNGSCNTDGCHANLPLY